MATPDDTQTVAPPDYPSPQDIQAALAARGVTASAAPSAAPAAAASPDMLEQAMRYAQQLMPQPIQPDTTPAQGGIVGLLGKIGMALAGGSVTDTLSPAQRERAGIRALGDFGTSLMAGSGYYPGKPMFGGLAQGFEGATRSEAGSEQQVAAQLGAQQDYQTKQAALRLKALKEALPYLTLQQQSQQAAAARALAGGGGGPAVPGTATGAGTPGGGGIALGMRQNNPLNLTFAGQPGAQPGQGNRFATFSDIPSGVAATADQLALYQTQHGINTVQDAVKRWVSDPKADLTSYTADVANALGVKPTDKIDLTDPGVQQKFILAAQPHESGGGGAVLNPADVAKGVQLAAGNRGQTVQAPPAPYNVATSGNAVPGPPSGSAGAPGAPLPSPPVPPADTSQAVTPPVTPPTHPDIPVPGGGVISHPGEFSDYRAKQFVPPTGEDFSPNLAPEQQQAFATKAQQLQLAQQQVDTLDIAKRPQALIDVKAKQADLAAEQQAAIAAKRLAAATATTKYNEGQQKDIQTRYDAATAAYNTAAHAQITGQQAIDLENVKSGNAGNAKFQEELNTDMRNMGTRVDDLQLLQGLSDNVGTPTPLTSIKFGGRSLADIISSTGYGGQDLQNKTAAVQAFRAGVLNVVRDLRAGGAAAGEPRSNQDLNFVMDMAPSEWEDPKTRTAIISYLRQVGNRRLDLDAEATRQMTTKLPNGQPLPGALAYENARKKLPDMVPQLPADGLQPGPVQDKFFGELKPYTFFRKPNGSMALYTARNRPAQ